MPDRAPIRVLGFSGSLRQKSFNRAALQAAVELAPEGMTIETFDISPFPVYNEDVREKGFPPEVEAFREKIRAADALLMVTPEYNYSIAAPMKNAIDWASRPPEQPFNGKPVAIMGATVGMIGTSRAQYHLRQVCVFLNMFPVNKPEVLIGGAQGKFDAEGRFTDEAGRDLIRQLLQSLADWTERLRPR